MIADVLLVNSSANSVGPPCSRFFQTILVLIYIQAGSATSLIDFLGFALWLFYAFSMISLFVLRKTMPDAPRPFKVWLVQGILLCAMSLQFPVFLLASLSGHPDVFSHLCHYLVLCVTDILRERNADLELIKIMRKRLKFRLILAKILINQVSLSDI